ncbi:hypothetical protein [Nocardia sp. NBC_00416]|uniref:hypothetical protein n=1 Tax=Nocardia sp. NBC_00416 TaxID=2975991 RepID=UPI002E207AF5
MALALWVGYLVLAVIALAVCAGLFEPESVEFGLVMIGVFAVLGLVLVLLLDRAERWDDRRDRRKAARGRNAARTHPPGTRPDSASDSWDGYDGGGGGGGD